MLALCSFLPHTLGIVVLASICNPEASTQVVLGSGDVGADITRRPIFTYSNPYKLNNSQLPTRPQNKFSIQSTATGP